VEGAHAAAWCTQPKNTFASKKIAKFGEITFLYLKKQISEKDIFVMENASG
jgi:hypothetical protein